MGWGWPWGVTVSFCLEQSSRMGSDQAHHDRLSAVKRYIKLNSKEKIRIIHFDFPTLMKPYKRGEEGIRAGRKNIIPMGEEAVVT